MKKIFLGLITLSIIVFCTGAVISDEHTSGRIDCSECHTCDRPTTKEPCLIVCPRTAAAHNVGKHSLGEAPDSMVLSSLENLYGPVSFDHKQHAEMSEMGFDCATCHHYSPANEIPPCRECHPAEGVSVNLSQPNLKGAYHRQCLSCHREWSHETKCVVCHAPEQLITDGEMTEDPTDIIGISHPVITVPSKEIYTTPYEKGPIVTFYHNEHVDLFDLKCANCHQDENCGYCHHFEKTTPTAKTMEEIHAVCNDCHLKDKCSKCHGLEEKPPFTHDVAGWKLSKYHTDLECRNCHPTGKRISTLNDNCNNCHAGWDQTNFRHTVVGLQLDEIHMELDCGDCHEDLHYHQKPGCDNCHDDDRDYKKEPPGELLSM
ncbi:MAG: cytochrome c3 family protein [bacterium]|nr:cytochrome c3 family protein [bacterium]